MSSLTSLEPQLPIVILANSQMDYQETNKICSAFIYLTKVGLTYYLICFDI